MSWVAVAVGAGSIVTGYLGSQSANKAGKAAQQGSAEAIAEARRQFDLVRGDTAALRNLNAGASNTLARLYGFGPSTGGMQAGPTGQPVQYSGGGGPNYVSSARQLLGPKNAALGLISPSAQLFSSGKILSGLFGSKKGDERRNLKAFTTENQIYDLGNGQLALADGTQFSKDQLEHMAGLWYGATHAPDGNQEDWQRRYNEFTGTLTKANIGQAGGGLTSEGVPQGVSVGPGAPAGATGKPDMSVFFESPDYQFNLAEGQKAMDRSLAARGSALSGAGVREGVRYASGMASREYGSFVDRLLQQAGLGSTGIGASATAGARTAGIVGDAAMTGAAARGSAYMQGANAINNSVQGGISNLLLSRYLGGG